MSNLSVHQISGLGVYANTVEIPSGNIFSVQGNFLLRQYTDATLPATGINGELIFNTDQDAVQYWSDTEETWLSVSGGGGAIALDPTLLASSINTVGTGGTTNWSTITTIPLSAGAFVLSHYGKHYSAPNGDPDPGNIRVTISGITTDSHPWKISFLENDSSYENRENTNRLFASFYIPSAGVATVEQQTTDPDAGGINVKSYTSVWRLTAG